VAERRDRAAIVFGVFFVLVGVAFLLDRLDVWTIRARYLPPVLLIAFGVAVLLGAHRSSPPRA
jgi:cell wall-active antibiotic response 4TMS protein YvqF